MPNWLRPEPGHVRSMLAETIVFSGLAFFTIVSNRHADCSTLNTPGDFSVRSIKRWLRQKMQTIIFVLFEPITKRLLWELERANLPHRDVAIANPLAACGRRFFSQNDEDGILLEILRRLEISEPSVFLEFGVDEGTECNTIILLALGWRGAWVSGGTLSFNLPPEGSRLMFIERWITRENAAPSAQEGLTALNADLRDVRVRPGSRRKRRPGCSGASSRRYRA